MCQGRLDHDVKNNISDPDVIKIVTSDFKVLSGLKVINEATNVSEEQSKKPREIKIKTVTGMSLYKVKWIVDGSGSFRIELNSQKGGKDKKSFRF